jgi:molecular chaperone GrpE (heat shock protein)
LERIATWEETFDPAIHEAVVTSGDGAGDHRVDQELRAGYRLRGKVLRAALVSVRPDEVGREETGPDDDDPGPHRAAS